MTTTAIDKLISDTEALEPGDVQPGLYVRKPASESQESPEVAGMVVSDLESAGYTVLYDRVSREPSIVNNNAVIMQLKQLRDDGTPVFTDIKPVTGPWRGDIKCFLHGDQPERARYTKMGFPVCKKSTLPNQYQAENHARNRHRDEWRAVEAEREFNERKEDREAQRAMMEAVSPQVATAPATPVAAETESRVCETCGWESNAPSSRVRASLRLHSRGKHREGK
jgi:hypothetical protein